MFNFAGKVTRRCFKFIIILLCIRSDDRVSVTLYRRVSLSSITIEFERYASIFFSLYELSWLHGCFYDLLILVFQGFSSRNTQRVRVARGPRYRTNRIIRSVCSLVIAIVRQCESVSVNVDDKQLLLPLAFCVVTQRVRYCSRKLHGQFRSFFRRVHFPASFHNLLPRNRKNRSPACQ